MTRSKHPRHLPRLLVAACAGLAFAATAQVSPQDPTQPVPPIQPIQPMQPGSPALPASPATPASPDSLSGPGGPGMAVGAGSGTATGTSEYQRMAQSNTSGSAYGSRNSSTVGSSLLPFTRSGYWGVNLGRPDFKTDCGSGLYGCDNPSLGASIYTGGLVNEVFGVELGYTNTGKASRGGGESRAQGVSLSLVGRVPLGAFNVFAKAGGLYGETKVSSDVLSNVPSGKRRGWGGQYAVGAGFDFTPTTGVVLEWTRNQWRFPGQGGRQDIDTTSLGFIQRF